MTRQQATTEVTLVSGGKVRMSTVGSPAFIEKNYFVPLGEYFLIGVPKDDPSWGGIHVWHRVGGIYRHLGNIGFRIEKDNSVLWDLDVWTHNTPEFEREAAAHLARQGKRQEISGATGHHMTMLSAASTSV